MTQTDAFAAIADANRRVLLEELRRGPKSVNQLSSALPNISRPAVSQHLKALLDAKLAEARSEGTSRIYSISSEGFVSINVWVDQFWNV